MILKYPVTFCRLVHKVCVYDEMPLPQNKILVPILGLLSKIFEMHDSPQKPTFSKHFNYLIWSLRPFQVKKKKQFLPLDLSFLYNSKATSVWKDYFENPG